MAIDTWRTDRRQPRKRARAAPLAPYLIVLAEADRPGAGSSRHRLPSEEVVVGRGDARTVIRTDRRLELALPDNRMSRVHARLHASEGGWRIADASSRNGTLLNGESCTDALLVDGDLIELGHTSFLFRTLEDDELLPVDCDRAELARRQPGISSFSPSLVRASAELSRIAPTDVPILLRGETGSGKEVMARAIHALSGRSGPFVAVNCGALPETLVESELFGHKKGAFSGAATDRVGLARAADGGTLFLDEIGDLSPPSQAALLRLLQEREVTPLGGSQPIAIDVKIVSATHRDLEKAGDAEFRRDLFARIAGYTVRIPALRDRREDLGLLVQALLEKVLEDRRLISLDIESMRALVHHDWPLNIRELESCLRVAAALAGEGVILPQHLPEATQGLPDPPEQQLSAEETRRRELLVQLLKIHRGNLSAVARAAGKARVQIQRWVRRYQLNPDDFKR